MESAMENTVNETNEKKRKVRPLKGTDIFLMTSIVGKIGLRNIARCFDLKEMLDEKKDEEDSEALGNIVFLAIADVVMDKLEACETPINKLLARLCDLPESDMKNVDANEYLDMIIDVVTDDNFVDFFKRAYESVKRMM